MVKTFAFNTILSCQDFKGEYFLLIVAPLANKPSSSTFYTFCHVL